ncbi:MULTISPECIES: hypothetical protein [unclassified Bradyrhizobium]|uniref:hypothetical protein n=1 Tax=unclassified Bradyrhizobium TaxID=2631580 RepID=UPI001CD561A9|nr:MULTISPECIES: hypothetical protein [unclassified Bradyrhizobium]MCA1375324.1 hypothetical protein [Bradyrhizobium sp. IC4060]MCA1485489.1 hypothetical protein [Bradyrhizobium sp. IC4061]MCA1539218.1 hypothetical protein [Bradyrhizobium sp. NBAIM32]
MGTFYTDEQIQEAIALLEDHNPGILGENEEDDLRRSPVSERIRMGSHRARAYHRSAEGAVHCARSGAIQGKGTLEY